MSIINRTYINDFIIPVGMPAWILSFVYTFLFSFPTQSYGMSVMMFWMCWLPLGIWLQKRNVYHLECALPIIYKYVAMCLIVSFALLIMAVRSYGGSYDVEGNSLLGPDAMLVMAQVLMAWTMLRPKGSDQYSCLDLKAFYFGWYIFLGLNGLFGVLVLVTHLPDLLL